MTVSYLPFFGLACAGKTAGTRLQLTVMGDIKPRRVIDPAFRHQEHLRAYPADQVESIRPEVYFKCDLEPALLIADQSHHVKLTSGMGRLEARAA